MACHLALSAQVIGYNTMEWASESDSSECVIAYTARDPAEIRACQYESSEYVIQYTVREQAEQMVQYVNQTRQRVLLDSLQKDGWKREHVTQAGLLEVSKASTSC